MNVPHARRAVPVAVPAVAVAAIVLTVAAPWLLGFGDRHAAIADHIAFAMAVTPIALLLGALPAAAPATIAAGAWLVVSPWVVGYATPGAAAPLAGLAAGVTLMACGARAGKTQ
ncbi:MAG TPA: SPW repeat protein [Baekduia sp.]